MAYTINYMLQEAQLSELHPLQELPPIDEGKPSWSVEKQAKVDKTLSAFFSHLGHVATSVALLRGRISSNLISHSGQAYSYIGIFSLHNHFIHYQVVSQASQTTFPPIMVISTLISFICSGGELVGSSLSNTISASLPAVIEPLICSSKEE